MKKLRDSRWTLVAMVFLLSAGTFFVMVNRQNNRAEATLNKIEMLKDSLIAKDMFAIKPDPLSRWADLSAQKLLIRKYSTRDSLTHSERKEIKSIDQQLNQLLHERHKH